MMTCGRAEKLSVQDGPDPAGNIDVPGHNRTRVSHRRLSIESKRPVRVAHKA